MQSMEIVVSEVRLMKICKILKKMTFSLFNHPLFRKSEEIWDDGGEVLILLVMRQNK